MRAHPPFGPAPRNRNRLTATFWAAAAPPDPHHGPNARAFAPRPAPRAPVARLFSAPAGLAVTPRPSHRHFLPDSPPQKSGREHKSGGQLTATFSPPLLYEEGPMSGQESPASGRLLPEKWQRAHRHFLAATFRLTATFSPPLFGRPGRLQRPTPRPVARMRAHPPRGLAPPSRPPGGPWRRWPVSCCREERRHVRLTGRRGARGGVSSAGRPAPAHGLHPVAARRPRLPAPRDQRPRAGRSPTATSGPHPAPQRARQERGATHGRLPRHRGQALGP